MSILVRIPTPLRRVTNGEDRVSVESGSINEIIGYLLQSLFRSLENSLEVSFFFEVGNSYFLFI